MIQPTEYFDNYPLEATTFSSTPLDHEVWGAVSHRARFQCWFTEALTAIANGYSVTARVEQSDTFDFTSFEEIGRGLTLDVETLGAPVGKMLIDKPCVVTKRYTRLTFFIYGALFGDGRISAGIQNLGLFGPYRAITTPLTIEGKNVSDPGWQVPTGAWNKSRGLYMQVSHDITLIRVAAVIEIVKAGLVEFRVYEGRGPSSADGPLLYASPAVALASGSIQTHIISGSFKLKKGVDYIIGLWRNDDDNDWVGDFEISVATVHPWTGTDLPVLLTDARVRVDPGVHADWLVHHWLTFEDEAVFPIGFDPIDPDNLVVTKNTTDLDSDESSYANRQVTVNAPVLWDDEIWIREIVPIRSDIKPALAPPWRPESFETEFDRLVRIQRQQQEQLDRCVRLNTHETYDLDIVPATIPTTGFWDITGDMDDSRGFYFTARESFVIRGVRQWVGHVDATTYKWRVFEGLGPTSSRGALLYTSPNIAFNADDDMSPRPIGGGGTEGYFTCLEDQDYIVDMLRQDGGTDWAVEHQRIGWIIGTQPEEIHGPLLLRGGRNDSGSSVVMTHWQLQIERKVENLSESLYEASGYTYLGSMITPDVFTYPWDLTPLRDGVYQEYIFEFIGTVWSDLSGGASRPVFRIGGAGGVTLLTHQWVYHDIEADGDQSASGGEDRNHIQMTANWTDDGNLTRLNGYLRITYNDIDEVGFFQWMQTRAGSSYQTKFHRGSGSVVGPISQILMTDTATKYWVGEDDEGGPIRVWGR